MVVKLPKVTQLVGCKARTEDQSGQLWGACSSPLHSPPTQEAALPVPSCLTLWLWPLQLAV